MQDETDRPSTETAATPQPPKGENVKALVTPGDDAESEAEAERPAEGAGRRRAGGADENDVARPEDADEAQSPT